MKQDNDLIQDNKLYIFLAQEYKPMERDLKRTIVARVEQRLGSLIIGGSK